MRAVMIVLVAFGFVLAAAAMFEMLHTPTARVFFAAVFAGAVVIIAAGLYLMPPRRRP